MDEETECVRSESERDQARSLRRESNGVFDKNGVTLCDDGFFVFSGEGQ